MQTRKIDTQTYDINGFVAFKLQTGDWQLGQPIFEDEVKVQREGTVSYHKSLADCKAEMSRKRRQGLV